MSSPSASWRWFPAFRASPPPALSGDASLRRTISLNNWNGVASTLALNSVQPFLGILVVLLGASDVEVAWLSALPSLTAVLGMVPGARLVDRARHKKPVTAALILGARLFFPLLAAVPALPTDRRPLVLVVLVGAMSLPGAVANVAWQAFIAGAIPEQLRGQAFAYRQRLMGIFGMAGVFAAGKLIDWLPTVLPIGPLGGYQVLFSLGLLFALAEVWAFWQMDEVSEPAGALQTAQPSARGLSGLVDLLRRQGALRRYTWSSLVFYLGWQMAWPLFTRYQVDVLGANATWVSLFTVANTASAVATYGVWSRVADRLGNRRALSLAALGLATVPLLFIAARNPLELALFNLWIGIFGGGVTLLLLNSLLELAPEEDRATALALYNTSVAVSGFVAPMVGVTLSSWLGLRWALAVAALIRALGALSFYRSGR